MEAQVISKKRVVDYGEVLTGKRVVNAMLDLVKQETERIDSRFLEPACGNGNFLAVILERKLAVIEKRYGKSQLDFERYAVLAISSIYGIDILEDNVKECRKRLADIFARYHHGFLFKEKRLNVAANYILERNIIWGDALTLKTAGDHPCPIVFSEWALVNGSMIKRRDFAFEELLYCAGMREEPLFSDLGEKAFIPKPVKEYPLMHLFEVADLDKQ